jgi:hypothetical protein
MKPITLLAILTLASFHLSSLPAGAANQQTSDKEAIFKGSNARWQGIAGCIGNQDETRTLKIASQL